MFLYEVFFLENKCAIEMRNITKRFGQVVANDSINLKLYRGEILALLGENGSGKTTLMNMLSGIYQPDAGEIFKDEEQIYIHSPREAYEYGIGMIHQHYKLIEVFSATQNIILGLNDGKMDLSAAEKKVKEICDRYGFENAVFIWLCARLFVSLSVKKPCRARHRAVGALFVRP